MKNMFSRCSSLKELDISNFNTKNVIDMSGMFFQCSSLEDLNICYFNMDDLTNKRDMFFGCNDKLIIKIKEQHEYLDEEVFEI